MRENLRRDFVLVGGTFLLSLGGNRKTEDVDIAVMSLSLHAFFAATTLGSGQAAWTIEITQASRGSLSVLSSSFRKEALRLSYVRQGRLTQAAVAAAR
ncbi:hypothetical protein M413DRAFT_442586 [Hebeloma cylindrosporum]|uniref:Uncharacterized protein n=1 Tax=Hebeloma cylindrosporum TaxID=76867 RepID=A0A0C3CKK9_HEBCY|nr:hypothetical protein M413DRAFT_442586 [Hebeloma cylindrosporum h7]